MPIVPQTVIYIMAGVGMVAIDHLVRYLLPTVQGWPRDLLTGVLWIVVIYGVMRFDHYNEERRKNRLTQFR